MEDNKAEYYLALRQSQKTFGTGDETILPWLEFFLNVLHQQSKTALELLSDVNIERLLWALGLPDDLDGFREWYGVTLADLSAAAYHVREPHWSECVAVGSRDWIESQASRLAVGRRAVHEFSHPQALSLAEEEPSYGLSASRRAADALLFAPGRSR